MTESTASPSRTEHDGGERRAAVSQLRAIREGMECVVLPPRREAPTADRAPVEIYLETEAAQHRANRVFVWSIEKVWDPGREVRIHLMSEMSGFKRRLWTTGFTNFRFAIPALAGGQGRAIHNDRGQIYLADPGLLFDQKMENAALLSISDSESSVMLIDCERMDSVWTLEDAQHAIRRSMLDKASMQTGLRGDLDPGWNARDEEFEPGESHLLHYSTLHTQPWRPFPERLVYCDGFYTKLWHELEREAIAQGFELFHRDAPSQAFEARLERLRALPRSEMGSGIGVSGELAGAIEEQVRRTKASSLLELAPDLRGDTEQRPGRYGLDVERRIGLLEWLGETPGEPDFDGVVCVEGLEALPIWDIPWIIESLFERASRFVFVAVRCPESVPRRRFLLASAGTCYTPEWWRSHFEAAAVRHPEISWLLMTARGFEFEPERVHVRRGGPRPDSTLPIVWTLTDGEPGNDTQVGALASALQWPTESRRPALSALAGLPFLGQGSHLHALQRDSRDRAALEPPWPDLLIVAGRRVAAVARWVRERSRGRTLVVALGAKAATPATQVDLAVTPQGSMLFPHPNRFEVDRPLVPGSPRGVAANRWRETIQAIPGPRLVFLIGSGSRRLGLDRLAAEALGRLVAESAASLGASVLLSASRNAEAEVFEGCLRGVGSRAAFVHHATRDQREDERAWPALVEAADLFVMVGLGEVTLAEISVTGRPVFLSPQLRSGADLLTRWRDGLVRAIANRARPANDRATTRPQQGLERICARLIAGGWIRPRRDVEALRGRLVRSGRARLLRAPIRAKDLEGFAEPLASEVLQIADRLREMLGVGAEEEIRER